MRLSGILLNVNRTLQDSELLSLAIIETEESPETSHIETLNSDEFEGVGIIRINNAILILEKDLAHGSSFDERMPSELDEKMTALSLDGQILCFLINSYSDVYAYSYFRDGERLSHKGVAGSENLPNALENETLKAVSMTENGIIECIEKVGGFYFDDLWELDPSQVNAYYKI